jgi:hypothetical protein
VTKAQATEALRQLGRIPDWRRDEPVRTFRNPREEEGEWGATGNVEPFGTRNEEVAAGGWGDTPSAALAAMVETARRLSK